jgi:hypothetical protein
MSKLSTLRGNLENDAKARRRFANVIFQVIRFFDNILFKDVVKSNFQSPLA